MNLALGEPKVNFGTPVYFRGLASHASKSAIAAHRLERPMGTPVERESVFHRSSFVLLLRPMNLPQSFLQLGTRGEWALDRWHDIIRREH